jgi:RNA polymerase sigma-54 factor
MIYAWRGFEFMSQKLSLSLKTSLNLTMSLRQSINILQMPHIDLNNMINIELEKNPFLQSEDEKVTENTEEREFDYLQISSNNENYNPLGNVSDTKSSFEYILEQISSVIVDDTEKIIAFYLANLLNENGFVELNIQSALEDLKCPESKIISTLKKLQQIEPIGIFARNLSESLELQLKDLGIYDAIYGIILKNLEMIAGHNLQRLAQLCRIENDQLIVRIKEIKKLNPRPISLRDGGCASTRIADAILTIDDNQNISTSFNAGLFSTSVT